MVDFFSRAYQGDFHGNAPAAGDPRLDMIESGPLRGRRAVTLGMVEALRQDAAALARELVGIEGLRGRFARERVRSIEHTLSILHRVARLPAEPATDYQGATA